MPSEKVNQIELGQLGEKALEEEPPLAADKLPEAKKLASTKPEKESEPRISAEDRPDKTPDEAVKLSREEKKARIAQVLSRGQLNERLGAIVDSVPRGRRGALVREKEEDIIRYRGLGYEVERNASGGQHGTGDDRIRVGDLILMTIPQDDYDIIQEVKRERTVKKLESGRREYLNKASGDTTVAPVFDESNTQIKRG